MNPSKPPTKAAGRTIGGFFLLTPGRMSTVPHLALLDLRADLSNLRYEQREALVELAVDFAGIDAARQQQKRPARYCACAGFQTPA